MAMPGSPSRRTPAKATAQRDYILTDLFHHWGLKIQPPENGESPSKRREKLAVAHKADAYADEAFFKIHFLSLKDETALKIALNSFRHAAGALHNGWVYKPNADDDLPRSFRVSNPAQTRLQREQLLECLLRFLSPAYDQVKNRQINGIPIKSKKSPMNDPRPFVENESLDETPIPFRIDPKGPGKRLSNIDEGFNDVSKRTRGLLNNPDSQKVIDAVDSVPVVTRHNKCDSRFNVSATSQSIPFGNSNTSLFTDVFKLPASPRNNSARDKAKERKGKQPENIGTSFTSNTSIQSSVFDEDFSDASDETYFSTQTSTVDAYSARRCVPERDPPPEMEYNQYGSEIGDFEVIDFIKTSPGALLRERLKNVFPTLPTSLQNAPLAIRYEISRVCSHAGVSMTDLRFPLIEFSNLREYDGLWNLLKSQPALRGKDFPEKSHRDAWTASLNKFHQGFNGVILSGKLLFNSSQEGPFFRFQLQPLKLEVSHRLGRRFGNDRFIEISIPSISGRKLPKLLKDAELLGQAEACRKVIVEWMTREEHNFLGVTWGAFYLRDNTKKRTTLELSFEEEVNNHAKYTVYLFATDGIGFRASKTLPLKGEPSHRHTKLTVAEMVDWLIPLEQNKQQKCLKLFSRIALGLSKTWKTIELDPSELRYVPDLMSDDNKEVMNDGCGRLSLTMAKNIVMCLGLSYVPSGFQARIGGAKGLWIIDVNDDSFQQWIEIYPSQMKWDRFPDLADLLTYEVDHRTFEVVNWVKPLRVAALNLQLIPLLEDRGKDQPSMRKAISDLLANGLTREIEIQRTAMDSPQTFRKWIRDNMFGIEERIKNGHVLYKAGIPRSLEEEMNMLLDAGFDPQRLHFLKELAWKACTMKCDMLKKKLNITVGRSTYAFMAVDFTGTLEPNEVYLSFSNNFTDDASGFSETMLDGIDILVARCPAHYISDIQRVRAVWKRELKALKDVIVFSSKGNFPLAKKLSGGDYDGDTAWICFEPTIVNEFTNAGVPECPDLVQLGYIQKDKITYADISLDYADPVPAFLHHSFEFNFQDNLLGMCTNFKESLCYTNNDVSNDEAVLLSTLLSDLVDQRKQGYKFDFPAWERLKGEFFKTKIRDPNYKNEKSDGRREFEHIIDYLKFVVADRAIEDTLERFHKSLPEAAYWDDDLVKLATWAQERARKSPDWKLLLDKLENDIRAVQKAWSKFFNVQKNPEALANFTTIVEDLYEQWQAIAPPIENPLSQALAPSCLPDPFNELSTWALLKALVGFSLGSRYYVSKFIWWMAGKQLARLKTMFAAGDGRGDGSLAVVVPQMYAMLRPDSTFVKLMQYRDHDPRFWEAKAESVVPDEECSDSDMEVGW